jgi:hypothetical protein
MSLVARINFSVVRFCLPIIKPFRAVSRSAEKLAVCNLRTRGVHQMALPDYAPAFHASAAAKKCRHVCNPTPGKPS